MPAGATCSQESLMLTGDENIIDIDCRGALADRATPSDYLFNTRYPGCDRQGGGGKLDARGDRPHADPAGADRAARADRADVQHQTQQILDQYQAGIEITQVQLQKVDPPAAVIESFRDVQRANTDAERMRNEAESYRNDIVPRARGDAARIVAEAEGAKQAIDRAAPTARRSASCRCSPPISRPRTSRCAALHRNAWRTFWAHAHVTVLDDKLKGVRAVPAARRGRRRRAPAAATPGRPHRSGAGK